MRIALSFMAVCLLLGCKDPGAKVEPATVEELGKGTEQVERAGDFVETLAITPENSKIGFVGAKLTQSHEGGFREFEGRVDLGKPFTASQIELTIQTDSIFTDDETLTKHLKSPDFFDVAKFPTATFKSTEIKDTPLGYRVAGDLTLHGETKRISFIAGIKVTDDTVVSGSQFSLNRQDFGISYPGLPDDLIRDQVVININLNLPRQGS